MQENNAPKKGGISVETEHIFPIIKKWLYSEKEIFLRELVSNACDAVTKLRRLSSLGEYEGEGNVYRIDVSFSKTDGTVTVSDNGIGMTADELDRYICKMALSGALEFVEKYEGKEGEGGIIGHFGLGFYSAFMVADTVELTTRSYTDAPAVHWECREDGSYEIEPSDRTERGTSIVLHVNEEGQEYLSLASLRRILDKYCAFMPVEIYLTDEDAETPDGEEAAEPAPINDVTPLWQKPAADCTPEQYKAFYTKVFEDYREPLFHLHLNADYPLNFKGILYFPKIRENFENLEGKIKLYYHQVFVADNIKEVIPEYLLMLRGVLDCPELPLNVSRSYLQNSAYVSKVSQYIVKKVADKLCAMFRNERESYEGMYADLKTFVEYASVCDRKFYDRVNTALLFTLTDGKKVTLDEYLDADGASIEGVVYYVTDPKGQASYVAQYEAKGIRVCVFDSVLDVRLAEAIEQYNTERKVKFVRVDADLAALKGEGSADVSEAVKLFETFGGEGKQLTVVAEALSDPDLPAILTVSEESRRMEEMMRMYAPDAPAMPLASTLTLNTNCDLIVGLHEGRFGEMAEAVAEQIYTLALLSSRKLEAEEMKRLLSNSHGILRKLL